MIEYPSCTREYYLLRVKKRVGYTITTLSKVGRYVKLVNYVTINDNKICQKKVRLIPIFFIYKIQTNKS